MKILHYNIPEELQDNSFIKSLQAHALDYGTLTENQIVALKSILGIELTINPYSLQTVKRYIQYFYRPDYHGDMLQDSNYAYNVSDKMLEHKIQDAHAAQYGSEVYVNEYKFVDSFDIPASVTNVHYFMNIFYDDYKHIVDKLERNGYRSTRNKNKGINALNSLTSGNPDEHIVNQAIFKVRY